MKSILDFARSHFRDMAGYVSAGMLADKNQDIVFMNANENPYALPGLEYKNRYPEPQPKPLVDAMAKLYGIEQDQILVTRGADEAIKLIIQLFCEPHQDSILINPPTFGIYKVDADIMPAAKILSVPLIQINKTYSLDLKQIEAEAKSPDNNVKVVFLCSPNNPTADSFAQEDLVRICKALEDTCAVVIDETYAEFSSQASMTQCMNDHPNLIILRTLSKSYALAGIRIGALLSSEPDLITMLRTKVMETYPLPSPAVEAALKALEPDMHKLAKDNIKTLLQERGRVSKELEERAYIETVFDSDANFLLVKMKDAHGFYHYACTQGIMLRDFSDKQGTENCLRISIDLPENNDRVLNLMDSYFKNN